MGACCCAEEKLDFNAEVELRHFHLLRSVGKGAFGKVRIVQHRGNNAMFALKYINKDKCIKMKAVDNIIQERKLLEEAHHPFICNLRYAFQDDENMFMIIDLMLGGDLRFHLDRMGVFTDDMVRFYTAEISSGLNYLHSNNIVHRDLKPDNVLLCQDGHAHLTDFNIAVRFRTVKPLTAVAGSMAYMAPEILVKKGYFATIDWWSLGVMQYELIYGKRPFRAKTNEALIVAIVNEEVVYPEQMATPTAKACMEAFLVRDVTKRLGVAEMGGFAELQKHPYFASIDWEKLEKKECKPPFVPDSKRANFDATHELEELLLEENPLRHKARKKMKEGEEDKKYAHLEPDTAKQMKLMDEKFKVFDHTIVGREGTMIKASSDPKLVNAGVAKKQDPSECSVHVDVMEGRDHEVDMTGVSQHKESEPETPAAVNGEVKAESAPVTGELTKKSTAHRTSPLAKNVTTAEKPVESQNANTANNSPSRPESPEKSEAKPDVAIAKTVNVEPV